MKSLIAVEEMPPFNGIGAFVLTWRDHDQAAAFTREIDGTLLQPGTDSLKWSEMRQYCSEEERSTILREIEAYGVKFPTRPLTQQPAA